MATLERIHKKQKVFFLFLKKYLIALVGNKVPQQVYVLHYIFEISRTLKTQQSSFLREKKNGRPPKWRRRLDIFFLAT